MSLRRIKHKSTTGGGEPVAPAAQGVLSLTGSRLSSPRAVMVVFPLLVAALGLFLALFAQRSLRASNLNVANERLGEQTRVVARSVSDALAQADWLLARMAELAAHHDPHSPYAAFAHRLHDLMRGRAGITYVSVSFPDGTFQGVYVDADGALRFQDSRIAGERTRVRRYQFAPHEQLTLLREEQTDYDPRKRGFYRLALERGEPAWTEPYAFFESHQTGITRTTPVYGQSAGQRQLHAVLTVDFDVLGMSSYLSRRQSSGTRALLFDRDGTVLAYATDRAAAALARPRRDSLLRESDLGDPVISALFRGHPGAGTARNLALDVAGELYLVALGPASHDPQLPWSIAYIAPEALFLRDLHSYERYSWLVGGGAVLLAVLLAFLLARNITRVRKEAAAARADAEEARKEARELGSYRLVSCLGKGAMGEVWRAEHRLLARAAAIKLISPALLGKDTAEVRARFRREAEALASLRSRNTIELFDYGVAGDGTFFFVTELLDGMDLESLVLRHGPQPSARVVQLLMQACCSLAEAHDQGLVHRDIKPANLFVCRVAEELDVVKVLDFGLVMSDPESAPAPLAQDSAQSAEVMSAKLTNIGGIMGTPAFMAPEQAMAQPLDGRSDLYSLACVGVWLLTGQLVYPYDDPMHVLTAHLTEPVPDLHALVPPSVPHELVLLLTRCLAKEPGARPAHVRELRRALQHIVFEPAEQWTEATAMAWWAAHHRPEPMTRGRSAGLAASTAPTLFSRQEG